jgi:glycosyltransferase involved in cell wall biosynthesis
MHIALFHDLPSGGAKRTLHELVRRLARRHRIDLYTLTTAEQHFCDVRPWVQTQREFPFTPAGLFRRPFGRLNQLLRWRDLGRLVEIGARIAAAIDAQGCDVLFAEPSMWTQAPPVLLHAATPSIYHCHEPPRALHEPGLNQRTAPGWRRGLDRIDPLIALYRRRALRLDRQAAVAARRVLVNSRFTRDCVREVYGVEARVLYHGVDVERFQPPAGGRRSREVLSVGALQPSKGFDFLIASFAHIAASARPRLRLVGNSEAPGERAYLTRCADRHGVELAIEVGVDDALLAQRYAEAALLVYAPLREPFGLAPLEAMACATPVVAVAEGGVPESVVDGETGRLVARDPRQFAAAVAALLDDDAARRRLGANGRALVCRQWTWDAAVARLEDELAAVVGTASVVSP